MPEGNPKYKKRPRPESIEFFENSMERHNNVQEINEISDCLYEIKRIRGNDIKVHLTNIYSCFAHIKVL